VPRFLHVANGTCTTRLIEAAGIGGALSIWADPLYEGPVPGGLSDEQLLDVRARYLAGASPDAAVDAANDLRRWRAVIADPDACDELVLWFEHDLFDQLNLVQLLAWLAEHVPGRVRVSLVCIGSFPGRPAFKGLGELTAPEIASLFETRTAVEDAQLRLAGRVWRAFTEPTPVALDRLRGEDTAALPFVAAALTRFLQEYPWSTDGLSRTERRLMQVAGRGQIDLAAAFPLMHDGEDVYYVTDLSLAQLASGLSRTTPPLLHARGGGAGTGPLQAVFELADAGRAVLRGEADRVALCGVSRWYGGVHLQSGGNLWRWDDKLKGIR
jgi:hypothetical protein